MLCFAMLIVGHIVHAGRAVAVVMVMRFRLHTHTHTHTQADTWQLRIARTKGEGYSGGSTSTFLHSVHMYGSLGRVFEHAAIFTFVPNR